MARKQKDIKSYLIPILRKASRWWPNKSFARDASKIKLQVGVTKSGKPKFKTFFKCAECERQNIKAFWTLEETQADHINPAIDPIEGFKDWNTYIARLFCEIEGYQILCTNHHDKKTKKENKIRRKNKK